MDNEKAREKMFNTMIAIAGRESIRKELAALPDENDIDYTFSSQFKAKMKRLFWHESRIRIRRRTFKALRVMAATIAIMSILFATAFAFVPEFQLRVMNMLLEWTEHSAKFTFSDNDNDSIAVNCPEFIPDGFVESDSMISKASAYIWYENSLTTEEILFTQVPFDSGNSLAIDHEHSDYTTISINGKSGHAFKSIILGEPSYIVFDDGQFAYRLSGEVNIDLLISMAKSIR